MGSHGEAFKFENASLPLKEDGEKSESEIAENKKRKAEVLPFISREDREELESLKDEDFKYQDVELISKGVTVGRYHRGSPTNIVLKGVGKYNVWEKCYNQTPKHSYENIDEIIIK